MLGRNLIILTVLTALLVGTTGMPAVRKSCVKPTSILGAMENSTEEFLRLVRTLVEAGELKNDGIIELLGGAKLGNPIDFASCPLIRKEVFAKALAEKLAHSDFDVKRARSGLREIAGLSKEKEDSRAHAQNETRKIVAVTDTGPMPGKKDPGDFWSEEFDMRNMYVENGVPYLVVAKGPGDGELAAVNLRDWTVREARLGGDALHALQTFTTPAGERLVAFWSKGLRLATLKKKGVKEVSEIAIPAELREGKAWSGPAAFTRAKDNASHIAVITRTDAFRWEEQEARLQWYKLSDAKDAKVHEIKLGQALDISRGVATATFGARTFLAVTNSGEGKVKFVDADSGKIHWDAPCAGVGGEVPHFFESGGEPRAAAVSSAGVRLFDPVRKADLGLVPLALGDSSGTPRFVRYGGKNLALIPRAGEIAVIDLDGRSVLPAIPTSAGADISPVFTEHDGRAYLTWLDVKSQEIVLADFDQRTVFSRLKDYIPKETQLVVFADGGKLRAMTHIPKLRPHTYDLITEPKSR